MTIDSGFKVLYCGRCAPDVSRLPERTGLIARTWTWSLVAINTDSTVINASVYVEPFKGKDILLISIKLYDV